MERKFCFIFIVIALIMLSSCGKPEATINEVYIPTDSSDNELLYEDRDTVVAQIDGAVNAPGVYEIPAGLRVRDLVETAGGMRDDAALESINLAEILADGMRYHILTVEEYEATKSGSSAKVNINTATLEQLMTLAGIGESKARSIIEYREKNGTFKSVEDLLKVSGIKRGTLDKILADITV
ncbi:MAG: ComEA family DNA-binding protein [Lachnospiraceae bacterium]|nr:ComEA family DNA-binding protein [Lachnospiraceae bacterium]